MAAITRACRLIERAERSPTLAELSAATGLSRFHLQRVFKETTGVTPRAYAAALRSGRVRAALESGASVTDALYAAGFGSSGRFYSHAQRELGMAPGTFKAGGRGTALRFAVGECSLGSILVAATVRGVCAILLGDDPEALVRDLEQRFPHAKLQAGDAAYDAWVAQVVGFVDAPRLGLELPLDIRGTAFQRRVWQALRAVPPGETISYTELAARIGAPSSVRAVASACAANPLAVAIPCHRVVRSNGDLSGYRWGIERKRTLLDRERLAARQDLSMAVPGA
jgi:AraC family transcriptional regulator of adaptative response/methylated-DNA-[protein]-cysteine methyltransferase